MKRAPRSRRGCRWVGEPSWRMWGVTPIPWFKTDDGFHSHPKARRASLAAIGLWNLCGSHAMAYKTDGFVPEWFVTGFPQGRRHAESLVRVGLWSNAIREDEHGYQFHDWLDYQQSAEEIERDRDRARERQRNFRQKLRERKPSDKPKGSNDEGNA